MLGFCMRNEDPMDDLFKEFNLQLEDLYKIKRIIRRTGRKGKKCDVFLKKAQDTLPSGTLEKISLAYDTAVNDASFMEGTGVSPGGTLSYPCFISAFAAVLYSRSPRR